MATVLALAPSPAGAVAVEFAARPVLREVLAVYDSRHERIPSETRIHKFAEMPLNFLGLEVRYVDVNGPLPDATELKRYRGIVSWLVEPLAKPVPYLQWLDRATEAGNRLVLMSELAPPETEQMRPLANRVLKRLGLQMSGEYVNITMKAKVTVSDPAMIGFERPLDKALPDFQGMTAVSPDIKVHLAIEAPVRDHTVTSALVVTGPGGGYASDEYAAYYDGNTDRLRWIVNPFEFLKRSLGVERFPIPDVTTLSGRRIYFSHIDGDGWNNVSEIEGYRQGQVLSSEVIAKEAIEAYPDLPITVGLIAGDVDTSIGGTTDAARIARRIYALPQVEVASHTYTHPFEWDFFEHYDRKAELDMIDKAHRPHQSLWDKLRVAAVRLSGREPSSERFNKYIAGSADLPRSYMRNPFDLDMEIKGSLATAEKLAPPGKKAKIMLWSGDTVPFEAAVKATREAGVRNMNGGDTRLDEEYPSVFYVPPISRPVGKQRQIYAGNSNENTYTNFWHGPYYGFFNLENTLRNTETPRRLKPFNVYYHMYMGEKAASLASLKHFLDLARKSDVTPITASHYASIADDFFAAEIEQIGVQSWALTRRGAMQTVRFDDADELVVDRAASVGVIGATRKNTALYVALDAAEPRAVVTLRARTAVDAEQHPARTTAPEIGSAPTPASTVTTAGGGIENEAGDAAAAAATTAQAPAEPAPWLVSGRWVLDHRRVEGCGATFAAQGYGPGRMTWQVAPGHTYRISASRAGAVLWQGEVRPDGDGAMTIDAPALALEPLELGIACHD